MTYFEDLSPYSFDSAAAKACPARNVGWLSADHGFPTEVPRADFLDMLWEHCAVLVAPTRGIHSCELCARPSHTFVKGGTRLLLGSGEIRVVDPSGGAFAAPNLIYHYVLEHHYRPPEAFVRAVEEGPRAGRDAYRDWLSRSTLDWRENPPLLAEPKQMRFVRTSEGVGKRMLQADREDESS